MVKPLGEAPLGDATCVRRVSLPLACREIVPNRVTRDVVQGVSRGDVFAVLADYDRLAHQEPANVSQMARV